MKTININGKEYSRDNFFETISIGSYYDADGCDVVDDIIEDFWHSKTNDFPRQQPEPPTLRPMSELPQVGVRFNILVLHTIYEAKVWDVGLLVRENEISNGFRVFKLKDKEFKSGSSVYKIVGWLPLPLPNPNKIKLPC